MQKTTVIVRGLTLPFSIGVLDHEKRAKQAVVIDIEIGVAIPKRPSEADQDYVSYAPIVEYLTDLSESGDHIDLVEELADSIFDVLFADRRVENATVGILKPEIFEQAVGVGVLMERSNPRLTS